MVISPAMTARCGRPSALSDRRLYACDMFIGSTLQIDIAGNSSTVTPGRIAGFGGARTWVGPPWRRHPSAPWLKAGREARRTRNSDRGRKLVVQMLETFGEKMKPNFVERLDSIRAAEKLNFDLAPVMITATTSATSSPRGHRNSCCAQSSRAGTGGPRGAGFTDVGRARNRSAVERCGSADHPPSRRPRHQLLAASRQLLAPTRSRIS